LQKLKFDVLELQKALGLPFVNYLRRALANQKLAATSDHQSLAHYLRSS